MKFITTNVFSPVSVYFIQRLFYTASYEYNNAIKCCKNMSMPRVNSTKNCTVYCATCKNRRLHKTEKACVAMIMWYVGVCRNEANNPKSSSDVYNDLNIVINLKYQQVLDADTTIDRGDTNEINRFIVEEKGTRT